MADIIETDGPPIGKKSKLPLILGIVLLVAGAAGGFLAVNSGMIGGTATPTSSASTPDHIANRETEELAFVALDPIIVSFSSGSSRQLLRFTAQLEVKPSAVAEVEKIKPRIVDVLNGYLRALEIDDLEAPAALIKLRSQMLHRVKIVAGDDLINDLLVMEFVLN